MATSARAQAHLQRWLMHRRALIDLLDRLPDQAADFRPWPNAPTTPVLVGHLVLSADRWVSAVRDGGFGTGERPAPPETIPAARELLRAKSTADEAIIGALTDAQLDAEFEFAPIRRTMSGAAFLAASLDHEIHHKGQLWTYARLCGVEPPGYVNRG